MKGIEYRQNLHSIIHKITKIANKKRVLKINVE